MKRLCFLLAVLLLLTGCGRAEVESTILTTAPTEPVVETTVPVTTDISETDATTLPETESTTIPTDEPTTEPSTEPAEEPTADEGRDYVLNNNSKKFHFPECSSVKQIKDSNRSEFHGTREELLDRGYSPCGRCKP